MKAVGYSKSLDITEQNSLINFELAKPIASGQDLLVKIDAIAVNPVDYKIRKNVAPEANEMKVIGWDAVGEVIDIGDAVEQFAIGDKVFYAGDLTRAGCNAEFQLVDSRIVSHKPKSLSNSDAAALPLTSITAWELLFEHLAIKKTKPDTKGRSSEVILVVGGAGGVGSILIQLAKTITHATIIATASRASSKQWVKQLGADHIIDHSQPLQPQIEALNIGQVTHVASLNQTPTYMNSYVEFIAPFGKIGLIDDPGSFDLTLLKPKSLSLHWEFMFARSMHNAIDLSEQGHLLNQVAKLVDTGHIQSTVGKHLGTINAQNLRSAHQELESGTAIGKIVLEGF